MEIEAPDIGGNLRSTHVSILWEMSRFWGGLKMCSEVFGGVWTSSDAFRCVQMRLDAFGSIQTVSGNFEFFLFLPSFSMSSNVFERFQLLWDPGHV